MSPLKQYFSHFYSSGCKIALCAFSICCISNGSLPV